MTTIPDVTIPRALAQRPAFTGSVWLFVAAVGGLPLFWYGFTSLVDAWSIPEYSHGPIIPLISTFLFLREMRRIPRTDRSPVDRWPGVFLMVAALVVALLGNLARIDQIVTYAFIVWIAGLLLVSFGLRRGLLFWPAIIHLSFMLPLPQIVYWQVSTFLQTVSSEIGVWVIATLGIPVFLDGNIIDLGVYKLQVAEACSGLRYLFPMLSFSFVFAVLYQGPAWHKVVLLLSAAPITVLMNSFRIGMIGVLVNSYGIEHAEGFLHAFEGWVIFIGCVALLFLEAMLLQRLTRDPRPLSETLDVSFEGLGAQLRRIRDVEPSRAMIAGALLTFVVGAGWAATPERDLDHVQRDPLVTFPRQLGEWEGRVNPLLDAQVETTLGADDYLGVTYVSAESAAPIDVFIAYYDDQTDGTAIHSPEVCIPAGGWEVSSWATEEVALADGETIPLNRAIIQKGVARQLVYFWFQQREDRLTSAWRAKFLNVRDSVLLGRSDGALVRLITPIGPNEPVAAAEARLLDLMEPMDEVLTRFIPR